MSTNTPAVRQAAQAPATTAARKDVKSLLEGPLFRAEIAKVLPKHLTPERMIRVAITATMKMPKLLQCTADSLTRCMLDCSALGLEPDGRRAHLIPFEDKKKGTVICTLIIDYKGLAELAMRSGLVSYLHADVVREGDLFDYSIGEIRGHSPWFLRRDEDKPAEPGQDIAAYAIARMKDGSTMCAVMSMDEVYSIRDNSQGWKAFKAGYTSQCPWDPSNWVSEQEMKKKTALRRLSKLLPLSPEFRDAVEKDDEVEELLNVTPKPAQIAAPLFTAPQMQADPLPSDPEPDPQFHPPAVPDPGKAPAQQTELDAKRQHIGDCFTESGVSFDGFRKWMEEKRNMQVNVDSFAELDEALVGRLMANLGPLVKQAKAFTEGGAK